MTSSKASEWDESKTSVLSWGNVFKSGFLLFCLLTGALNLGIPGGSQLAEARQETQNNLSRDTGDFCQGLCGTSLCVNLQCSCSSLLQGAAHMCNAAQSLFQAGREQGPWNSTPGMALQGAVGVGVLPAGALLKQESRCKCWDLEPACSTLLPKNLILPQ